MPGEHGKHGHPACQGAQHSRRAPAERRALDEAEGQPDQADGDEHGTGKVDPATRSRVA